MKRSVGWRMVGVAVLVTAVMATVAQAQQPTVVFSIRGIEPLLNDIEFIGGEVGQEDAKATAEQLISAFTNGKGLAGVDQTKPLGLYWNATAAGAPEMPVAFLPVSDADALKDLLTDLTPDFKDAKGQWSMTVNGIKLFAKVSGGYCFISNAPTSLSKVADPTKITNAKYDIALEVSIAGIPSDLKDTFLAGAESGGRQAMENSPEPESEAEKVGRDVGFTTMLAVLKSLVNDGDKLTLGVDVDEETRLGAFDFGITGKGNTDLAKSLTAYGKTVPAFAGIGSEGAPLRLVISYPTTGITEQLDAMFNAARESANEQIDKDERIEESDRATAKSIAGRLFDIAKATAKSGSVHSGVVLESGGDDKIRVIAATRVAQGDAAAKLMDDVVKLAKDKPDIAKVKLDAAKHAGARIHAITPEPNDDNEKYFGDEPAHLAFRTDSLWASIGGDNLNALKKALDMKPATRATVSPISIQVKPAALVGLMEKDDEGLIERAKGIVGKPGDKMNLDVAPIPNGAKLHIEFGIDLLQLAEQEDK